MSDVIKRLTEADEAERSEQARDGKRAGREWAEKRATPRELRRLESFWHDVDDWDLHASDDAFSPGERLAEMISGVEMDRHAMHGWWLDVIDGEPWTDTKWIKGFCEGALEVWEEVEDQI